MPEPHEPHVPEIVASFFERYPIRSYDDGQLLIHAGDDSPSIFYIVSGAVRQYDISYRGAEVVVNKYKPGAFFPMLGAITGRPNTFFFAADATLAVRVAPRQEVVDFLHAQPAVAFDLLTRLYSGVDGLLGRMAQLMAGSARNRLLYEILIECRRFGTANDVGVYTLAFKESDMAAAAGLSRETVSRELQKLSHEGLVRLTRGSVAVPDIGAIEQEVGRGL